MGGIYPHRFKGEIKVGVYRNVWSWREMACCDRSSGWDRHCRCFCFHRMERPHLTFSFRLSIWSVFWWRRATFNSIWHEGNMTYSHFQHLFILPVTSWRVCLLLKDRYYLLCVQSSAAASSAALLQWRSPPSCCSFKAFSLGGRLTGSLWHELFVRGFRDWLVSLCPLKMAYVWVLEQSKVTAMSPSITTRWLTGKMGWALLLGSNKNTNKVDRETTDYTTNLNLHSFGYCKIIAPKRKSLKRAFNQFPFGPHCMKRVRESVLQCAEHFSVGEDKER